MKSFLRWIGVLPGAIAASLVVQVINAVFSHFMPDLLVQWWNSWAGTLALILAGVYIAPKYKFMTAVSLAVLYAGALGAALTMGLISTVHTTPVWNVIVCAVISLVAVVMSCGIAREMEDHGKRRDAEAVGSF